MKLSFHSGLIGLATLGALCASPATHAGLVVNIAEVGADVVFSMNAGTLDTTGLNISSAVACGPFAFHGFSGAIGASSAGVCISFEGPMTVTASAGWTLGNSAGASPLSSFTGLNGAVAVDSGPGLDDVLFLASSVGTPVVGLNAFDAFSGTVAGGTFSALGLTANQSIEFNWGSDSLLFTTGAQPPASVPEPASLALVALALAGLAGLRRRAP